ncbi:MAG: hypothetical protein LAQ69_38815 [Acidobacteriia bacterium]|nr:hypothetical protein [Terriglobia bacterium]
MMAKGERTDAHDASSVKEELRRLIESPGLQQAESLRLLLSYLVEHSLEHPQEHVKEYQIAVDVFRRPESFDPRLDSTVRVQTSRLRNKLIEYYATTGVHDPLVIEIPRGAYSAIFQARTPTATVTPNTIVPLPEVMERTIPGVEGRHWLPSAGMVAALAVGLAAGLLLSNFQPTRATAEAGRDRPDLRAFWNTVLKSPEAPLLIFSNAEFKGRPETGLRYFDAKTDSREHINDLYTGVGEVLAIGELSRVFRALNRDLVVKRSGLLGWDDTRNRDLIFVGSPTENLSLRDLPLSQEFVFRSMEAGERRPGDLAIVNEHPHAGEPEFFLASPALPLSEDYAVVTLLPGLHAGQNLLLLAGTTTLGTQAAAEFVCQNESLGVIRKRLGVAAGGATPPFSAVIHVRIARGVPVESTVAAIHSK